MSALKRQLEKASKDDNKAKKEHSNYLKLRLYANFKQCSDGNVICAKRGLADFVRRAKYNAWARLNRSSNDQAMNAYVKLVEKMLRGGE